MKHRLFLPWFNHVLSPNVKVHWRTKFGARKKQRKEAFYHANILPKPKDKNKDIPLTIIFHPPIKNRDLDGCLSSIKGALDGIADHLGVNDKRFRPITIDFGERKPETVEIIFDYEKG